MRGLVGGGSPLSSAGFVSGVLLLLLCRVSLLPLCWLIQGRHYSDLGGKVHLGSARGALAMAMGERNEGERLEQMIPMKEALGRTLHCFSLRVREALKVDQCIL